MRNPTKIHQRLKDLLRSSAADPLPVLIFSGSVSLLAYMLFALVAFFLPNADMSHFPPYIGLPEGGFDLSSYYLLYTAICLNALTLFGFYLFSLRSVGAGKGGPEYKEEHEDGDAGSCDITAQADAGKRTGIWSDRTSRTIFIFAVLFHIVMFITPFLLSTDIFDYIRHGRIFAIYGENPLIVPATYFPQDPFFGMGGWVGTGSVYGSLHVYITAALARIAGDGIGANLMLFKAFFISLNLVNLLLIWKITSRVRPELARKALVFYGWNPFVLTLVVANAHNDILMLTLVLAGFLFYLDRRYLIGVLCLTAATLVKFIALPILIVYIALAMRKQRSLVAGIAFAGGSLALAAIFTLISYLPLWAGRDTFLDLTTVGQKTNFTISALIRDAAAGHIQLSLSNSVVQFTLAGILLAYLIWHIIGVRNFSGLVSASAGLALLTPLALFWFQPWYLTLGLGLVALRPWRYMYIAALAFSFSVMFFDSFWWHAPVSMDIQKPVRVLVVFGPPLVLLAVLKARESGPDAWSRLKTWAFGGTMAARSTGVDGAGVLLSDGAVGPGGEVAVSDPSPLRLAVEISVLLFAAAIPMAAVIASSPTLRSFASLVAVKLRLLVNF